MVRNREASVTTFVQEELSDARLRTQELTAAIQEVLELIDDSKSKDHLYEVAGHLIESIPVKLLKVQKALDATAYAINGLDQQELKYSIRKDKLDDLDRVLEDVRVRMPRRSGLDKYEVYEANE